VEVRYMNAGVILVIVIGVLIVIGGPIIGHYAEKASHKAEVAEKAEAAAKAKKQ
jgi:multisubunit Na+/H+ antiporter MnhG subunit